MQLSNFLPKISLDDFFFLLSQNITSFNLDELYGLILPLLSPHFMAIYVCKPKLRCWSEMPKYVAHIPEYLVCAAELKV